MKISEKIAYLRKDKGWSQEQLAIKLEVSRQAVYKWEADINQPDIDKLKRIASVFNVSYDILMDDNIELPLTPNVVETEAKEPEVEIIENIPTPSNDTKAVHNEVAVQINYGKDTQKSANKKLIILLCVFASVFVVCLCVLSYVLFGIVLQKESFLVKFDAQGGTAISDLIIKDGKEINSLASTAKSGYTFDGWYVGDKKWDFDTDKVKGNITLTAKWIPNRNTITYVDNATGEKTESFANTDETVVLLANTFKKDGYTFLGWATSPNGSVVYGNCASYKMGTENVTLYAIWSSETYDLVLNVGDGTLSTAAPSIFTSSDSIILPIPILEFYSFDGWYDTNGNKMEIIPKGTTSDIILTARYTPITYNITYVLNGGINNTNNPSTYNADNEIYLLSPERTEYSFMGWYLDEDFTTQVTSLSGSYGSVTLYAKWDNNAFSFMAFNDGYTVIGYSGLDNIVRIPSKYEGVRVLGIYGGAFYGNTEITEIIIPSTVTNIDVTAFDECASLTAITVESGNSEFSSENGILYDKQKTVIHKYPMGKEDAIYVAPSSLDVVNPYAFAYAIYLEKVYLPDDENLEYGVGKICASAFEGCISLTSIELGYLPNYFEANCFKNCWSLESIEFKAETVWGIGKNAFESCFLLTDVIFSSTSVKEISNNVFMGCLSLESIELTNVEKLGTNVFENSGLKEIYIPLSVTSVGSDLFVDCEELIVYCEASSKPAAWDSSWSKEVKQVIWGQTNPNTKPKFTYTTSSNYATITGCIGTGEVVIPNNIDGYIVNSIGANAFTGQDKITKITIPNSVTTIDKTAFDSCTALEELVSEHYTHEYFRSDNGVLYADNSKQLFKYPEGKKDESFTVPYNIDIIKAYAFKNNPYLTKVILPSDVTNDNYVGMIEQGAFENCTALTTVEGCCANYLERDVFRNCSGLTEITFYADDVWGIGNYSFLYCTSLESVTFKGNMNEIGYQVFGYCTKLSNVTFEGTLGSLSVRTFENCVSLESITLPEGVTAMVSEAFKGCTKLSGINIPSTVTKIEDYAFIGTAIKEILIPATVIEIEEYAFLGLSNLTIFCEATEKPSGWNDKWNAISDEESTLYHTVAWGIKRTAI